MIRDQRSGASLRYDAKMSKGVMEFSHDSDAPRHSASQKGCIFERSYRKDMGEIQIQCSKNISKPASDRIGEKRSWSMDRK